MPYFVRPNYVVRKGRKVSLSVLLAGEQDLSQFNKAIFKRKPNSITTKKSAQDISVMSDQAWYNKQKRCILKAMLSHYFDPEVYREFQIPKKSGGMRTLKEPIAPLKDYQKRISAILQCAFPVPYTNAYAYVKKRSTLDALKKHQANKSKWFLKLDIENFFSNTTIDFAVNQLAQIYPFSTYDKGEIYRFLGNFMKDKAYPSKTELPQGAPSSPVLSNLIMIPFDYELNKYLRRNGFVYTRYADDILISHRYGFKFKDIEKIVEDTFWLVDASYKLNKTKTRYGNSNGKNWNLGLMLNKDNNITVGHKEKKLLKAKLTKLCTNSYDDMSAAEICKWKDQLNGVISYYRFIEMDYINYLIATYEIKYNTDIYKLLKS